MSTHLHDQVHVVLDQQQRGARTRQADDQVGESLGLVGIEPRRRLVEQQQLGLGDQRPTELGRCEPARS